MADDSFRPLPVDPMVRSFGLFYLEARAFHNIESRSASAQRKPALDRTFRLDIVSGSKTLLVRVISTVNACEPSLA
jgi:hypothetical protein